MSSTRLRRYQAPRYDEPLIMEMGQTGERGIIPTPADEEVRKAVGAAAALVPAEALRSNPPALPEISQYHVLSHFLRLSQMTLGMETGIDIGEGTCTMKYSPKMHEELVRSAQMAELHPLQPEQTLQGILEITYSLRNFLKEISGMDEFSFQTGGGSHAAYLNAAMVRRYFELRGELGQRTEMIATQFSHPCDAATPATAGFRVITLPHKDGYPDLEALKAVVSERTAGLMLANPEDTGIYNTHVKKFTDLVHQAGGLCFYDQANANGILGIARAREAGFDACHFNLHKTFSAPHGCEGPATGAYGCSAALAPCLPVPVLSAAGSVYHLDYDRPESLGKTRSFYGNLECVLRAYAWIRSLGAEGLRQVAETSVLNNQYLDSLLMKIEGISLPFAAGHRRLEQARYSMEQLKEETGLGSHEIQDRMVDFGIQSYWLSHHPFVVPEPFTPEPCETYSKSDIEYWAAVIERCCQEARRNPKLVESAPHNQPVGKIQDFSAADDPERWAITWRGWRKKKQRNAERKH